MDNRNAFLIHFPRGHVSPALKVAPGADAQTIIQTFGLLVPRPVIILIGGASAMSATHLQQTFAIIQEGIAPFAEAHHCTVVDGGTEAGVMQMIGRARLNKGFRFPLIGASPLGKIRYPGWDNPASEAQLQGGHTHFVLVKGEAWGDESQTLINLARAIAGVGNAPIMGVLINGGSIAEKEVYLASASNEPKVPMFILDGSGRAADSICKALRTGQARRDIIQDIITRGDIHPAKLKEGPEAMRKALESHFAEHKRSKG